MEILLHFQAAQIADNSQKIQFFLCGRTSITGAKQIANKLILLCYSTAHNGQPGRICGKHWAACTQRRLVQGQIDNVQRQTLFLIDLNPPWILNGVVRRDGQHMIRKVCQDQWTAQALPCSIQQLLQTAAAHKGMNAALYRLSGHHCDAPSQRCVHSITK